MMMSHRAEGRDIVMKKSHAKIGHGIDHSIPFHLTCELLNHAAPELIISIVQAPIRNYSTPRTNGLTPAEE